VVALPSVIETVEHGCTSTYIPLFNDTNIIFEFQSVDGKVTVTNFVI